MPTYMFAVTLTDIEAKKLRKSLDKEFGAEKQHSPHYTGAKHLFYELLSEMQERNIRSRVHYTYIENKDLTKQDLDKLTGEGNYWDGDHS